MSMKLACLVPTYGRPRLVQNVLACFLTQSIVEDCHLYILDDAGQINEQQGPNYTVFSTDLRFPNLPAKYDWLVAHTQEEEGFVVMDDDDIYLPWYCITHRRVLENKEWSHPKTILSNYTGELRPEIATGRFHGALAMRREAWQKVRGWLGVMPEGHERRADFDQRMLHDLARDCTWGNPNDFRQEPSYVFRWQNTGASHCQSLMKSPEDETWWENNARISQEGIMAKLTPRWDDEAIKILEELGMPVYDFGVPKEQLEEKLKANRSRSRGGQQS